MDKGFSQVINLSRSLRLLKIYIGRSLLLIYFLSSVVIGVMCINTLLNFVNVIHHLCRTLSWLRRWVLLGHLWSVPSSVPKYIWHALISCLVRCRVFLSWNVWILVNNLTSINSSFKSKIWFFYFFLYNTQLRSMGTYILRS